MSPTSDWPIGTEYCVVQVVTHRNPLGVPDPSISERYCLPHEAARVVAAEQERNPYATAWVTHRRQWRGYANG